MKKGVSHVDWVISMTIFILGVLTILIFLVPLSNKPLYPKEVLLNIVEDNFRDNYYWTVKKVPLFVTRSCSTVTITFENGWVLADGSDREVEGNLLPNFNYNYFVHNPSLKPKPLASSLQGSPSCINNNVYVGAEQNFIGVSNVFLNQLRNKDYNDLKQEWNYPAANDFAIYVDNQKIIGPNQPIGINVFVNQFRDFIVDENGELQQVTVSLRAW